ncbi:putative acetyltransferase [Hydrogenispora ethanolica]|uniref:Putative acetyltransferase n=1 Tax=Hydrogenispora ethanolica TaxID=1082276 RepID=A0A4R1RAI8_HYDET|nr:GNAT family N-acetyltransferase [Hydrogenispora ethanolica]TCL62745.1 putative acetyltransferase [Hydrogenispora ethanolica]
MLKLVKPDIQYQTQYREMLDDWRASGEEPKPWVLQKDCTDFQALVEKLEGLSRGINVPEGFVPSTTFWAYDNETDQIVGAVNIRHSLNDLLLEAFGNIGYGVRPGARRKGYATTILKLALAECKNLNLKRVLLGCYRENVASARIILKNGGVLENEVFDNDSGKLIQRYWIEIE